MKRKALGKGLSALLPDPEPTPARSSPAPAEVPIGEIEPNPQQPRTQDFLRRVLHPTEIDL